MASNNEGGNIKKIMVNLDALQTKAPKKTTRKNPPNIEPNRLKDTFMKQVQHYKSLANTKKQKQETTPSKPLSAYTDEFNASVEYLNNIKKSVNLIQTELPTELIDDIPIAQIPKPMLVHEPPVTTSSSIKYKVDNDIPYGCLKNGIKQTLKNMTRNNRPRQTEPSVTMSSTVVPSSLNVVPLNVVPLKPTITSIPSNVVNSLHSAVVPPRVISSNVVNSLHSAVVPPRVISSNVVPSLHSAVVPSTVFPLNVVPLNVVPLNVVPLNGVPLEKTIIKRHVIGKSKKSRHVGVLIKNASTRKMITDEYKKLKKTNISEVKTQLKNNGLLKVGSTAPSDILRQTYESSILAGLVKNDSEGTTYHNFMNEENNK